MVAYSYPNQQLRWQLMSGSMLWRMKAGDLAWIWLARLVCMLACCTQPYTGMMSTSVLLWLQA